MTVYYSIDTKKNQPPGQQRANF